MNGFRMSSSSRGSSHTRNESFANAAPPARILVDQYSNARNRVNGGSYQSQTHKYGDYSTDDPVSMHLLMENALGDSKLYKVLSPDHVDSIKRELSILGNRIEATQRKLVLETKVRDATHSMGRLQKPGAPNGAAYNSEEVEQAARNCDELGQQIWELEKQEQQLIRALLEHNAAVLQMTHRGFLKNKAELDGNGITDIYDEFAEFAHYKPSTLLLDDFGLAGEDSSKPDEHVMLVGRRVDELNARIRDMMHDAQIEQPGAAHGMRSDPANIDLLFEQIDFLEASLDLLQHKKGSAAVAVPGEDARIAEQNLQNANFKLYQNLSRFNQALSAPPDADGHSLPAQVDYLSDAFGAMMQQLDKVERYDSVVTGLWQALASPQEEGDFSLQKFSAKVQEIQVKYSGLQEQKEVLSRQIQQQRELNEKSDSTKDSEIQDLTERLETTRSDLDNARQESNIHLEKLTSVLEELEGTRARLVQSSQAEQQRGMAESQALNQEREARQNLESELQQAKAEIQSALAENSRLAQQQNHAGTQILEQHRQATEQHERALEQEKLALEEERQAREKLESLLDQAKIEVAAKSAQAAESVAEVAKAEDLAKEMEARFVHAQTELTIARAELDGALGSRAQRAAEIAGDPVLQGRIQKLEKELQETIGDYETMTKSMIEYEKEREQFESTIDGQRDKIETLESQLSEERINVLGSAKSPSQSSERGGSAGTAAAVLRNEFRKMMKDQRTEHSKALRAEQEERRKLEATLRALKKDQLQTRGSSR